MLSRISSVMFLALELALFDYVKGKIILFLASHHSSGQKPSNNFPNEKENVKNVSKDEEVASIIFIFISNYLFWIFFNTISFPSKLFIFFLCLLL